MSDVTLLLEAGEAGDPDASPRLLPLVCDDLHRLAAVPLVHNAFLRLLNEEQKAQHWRETANRQA
jgi:hypothetical protein